MTAADWLARVEPPVPEGFRPWLEPGGRTPTADGLRRAALDALARALAPEGRERGGAFDLLAADAFLTWAAEAALDTERPEVALRGLVRSVAGADG